MKKVVVCFYLALLLVTVIPETVSADFDDTCVYDVVVTHQLHEEPVPSESFYVSRETYDSSGRVPFNGTYFYRAVPPDNSETSVFVPQVGTSNPSHRYALVFAYFANHSGSEVVVYVRLWVGQQVLDYARFTVPPTGQWVLRDFALRLDQPGRDNFFIQYGIQGSLDVDAISVVTSKTPTGYTCYRMYVPSIIGGMRIE